MLTLRKITSLARTIQRPVSFGFAGDKWKDRDQAAEKVFVSQQESTLSMICRINPQKITQKSRTGQI